MLVLVGGLGPLMAIGEYSESFALPGIAVWALAVAYFAVYFGGLACCVVNFRGLRYAFASAGDRPVRFGDHAVAVGHLAFAAGLANAVLRHWHLWDWDLFYLLLMFAAAIYALGLGMLAVAFRSTVASHAL